MDSIFSLIPPISVILMVIITRKVAISLLVGIALGGIILYFNNMNKPLYYMPFEIINYSFNKIIGVFYSSNDGIIFSSLYIFLFLILLGVLSQIILYSGAINAFVVWAHRKVNTPTSSEFMAFIAGIVIFIDDYFNALTVGQISKSLNDVNKSSRERLAYIIDSTSAPICILMPISSWGAYTIGVLDKSITDSNSFILLTDSIWSNYYAWFALLGVFLTILWQINLPSMQRNINVGVNDLYTKDNTTNTSSIWFLIIPISSLIISIFSMILYTGYKTCLNENKDITFINILANTDTSLSLFYGGIIAVVISFFISFKNINTSYYFAILKKGILSMMPAIIILILAWAIGPVIKEDMQTGKYLANISIDLLSNNTLLPAILFLISAFIALATGTSWGTFAIVIPIGVDIALANEGNMILCISSIIAGAVFGDHSSPISDTTILSSTGAGCSVQSHFITQLPYVITIATISFISFIISGILDNVIIGYLIGLLLMLIIFYFYKQKLSKPLNL